MNLVVTVAPTTWAVDLDDVWQHLRITEASEDNYLRSLIKRAQSLLESRCGRALTQQTLRLTLDELPDVIEIPRPPLIAISSLTYVDSNGVTQTLTASDYQLDSDAEPAILVPAYGTDWPDTRDDTPGAVRLTYTAGYTTTRLTPEEIRQAMLIVIGHWYENREAVDLGAVGGVVSALINSFVVRAEYEQ